jgi:DNA helicase-2/ATP-dependent DNA helicase PcrA
MKYVGPPGVGKTSTLVRSCQKNAETFGSSQVVCCSLTKAAAAVLRGRDTNIPEKNIGTLHSLAYRSLGKIELTVKHEKEFSSENMNLRLSNDIAKNVNEPYAENEGKTYGDKWRQEMDILRARRIPRESKSWDQCRSFAERWEEWKKSNDLMDFTDLLETCLDDVDSCPGDPAVLLVDEAQDLSKLGIDLLLKWGRSTQKIIFAGDDRQALYDWAGADAEAFIGIVTDEANRKVINQSYRVPREIHKRACQWVERLTVKEEAAWKPRDFEGSIGKISSSIRNPEAIVGSASKLSQDGRSVMILSSCSYMLSGVIRCLRQNGIPFCNRYRTNRGDWNPLVHGGNRIMPTDRVLAFLKPCSRAWPDTDRNSWTLHDLSLWLEMLESKDRLHSGAKEALKEFRKQYVQAGSDDIRKLATPETCSKIMAACYQDTDEELKTALLLLRDSCLETWKKKIDFPLRIVEKHGPESLREMPKITVGTIHSVKGGECQDVFLMPDLSPKAWEEWNGGPKRRDAIIRLFYVGMTRASENLILCAPSSIRSVQL